MMPLMRGRMGKCIEFKQNNIHNLDLSFSSLSSFNQKLQNILYLIIYKFSVVVFQAIQMKVHLSQKKT